MSTSGRVLKNTTFLYLRLGISLFVSLWTTRIVLNALGVDDFGIYNLVGGIIALLGFLNATLSSATQRYLNYAEGQKNVEEQLKIFNNSFLLHLMLAFLLVACFIILGIICFNDVLKIPSGRIFSAKIVYLCMVVSTILSIMNVPYEASINAHENMVFYAYIGIFEVLAKLGIAYSISIVSADKLIVYALLMTIVPIITFILMRLYCSRKYRECKISLKRYIDKNILKDLGKFAGWNFMSSATGIMTQYGFNIVINHFFGVVLNAAQGIASQVSGVLVNVSSNALKALNPIIVKSESINQHDKMIYVSLLGCRITFLIFIALSFLLVVGMEHILTWWLKTVPEWAVLFCQLQLVRICIEMLTLSLSSSIMAYGDIKNYNIYRSIINLTPLITSVILFQYNFAPYWIYINWILGWSVLGGIINVVYAHKKVSLAYSHYIKIVLLPSLKVLILPVFIVVLCHYLVTQLYLQIIITFASWSLLLILCWKYLLFMSEKQQIKAFLKLL